MRVLVTGAAGFIGFHLVQELLARGHDVIGIDDGSTASLRPVDDLLGDNFIPVDISNERSLSGAVDGKLATRRVDCIYHLAAKASIVPSVRHPDTYHAVNVTGTLNMLMLARAYGISRFVYAASGSCYGIPSELPTTELCPVKPLYPYALTKLIGEEYVFHLSRLYGIQAVSLRLFNVFGPRMCLTGGYGGLFSIILPQKFNDAPVVIIGDGGQRRDFVFVTDVAKAFCLAGEHATMQGVFNVGRGQSVSINDILKLLQVSKDDIQYLPDRPGEPRVTIADTGKIQSFGWYPSVSFERGLDAMLEDQARWKSAPVWTRQAIVEAQRQWYECFGAKSS